MSQGEYQAQMRDSLREDAGEDKSARAFGALMLASVLGGQVTSGPMCPVFAQRLGGPDGRKIADAIRAVMNGGG
jgi:hypothetical protein